VHQAEETLQPKAQLVEAGLSAAGPRDDEDVGAAAAMLGRCLQDVADAAADAVAYDGTSDALAGRDPVAVVVEGIGQEVDDEMAIGAGAAMGREPSEVGPAAQHRQGPTSGPDVRR